MSAPGKKNRPASPVLGMSKFTGEREFQLEQSAGEKSGYLSDQFSPQDIFALAQSAAASACVATQLQALKPAPSPRVNASTSPTTEASTLSRKVLLLEKGIDELLTHIINLRSDLDKQLVAASLRSVEQATELLSASRSQVYRWTKSGELRATWLDQHPRYRPNDLQAFIDSRAARGRPIKKAKTAPKAATPKRGVRSTSRKKSTQGRSKSKNMKKRSS